MKMKNQGFKALIFLHFFTVNKEKKKSEQVQVMKSYCEQICISQNIRLDLFTAESFRMEKSKIYSRRYNRQHYRCGKNGKTPYFRAQKFGYVYS